METVDVDAERLLRQIGAWEEYGASGWGTNGTQHVFQSIENKSHATHRSKADSWSRLAKYYTPELEQAVEDWYALDYEIERLVFVRTVTSNKSRWAD